MREDGFYWVLYCDDWQVARWHSGRNVFLLTGTDEEINESDVSVDNRRVYRNPPENCMPKCSCGRELHQYTYCKICDNDE